MKRKQQGFAILISAIVLSVAGIVYTANMATSQLIDNQVLSNYYRNNEAFVNAESGINLILSKLDTTTIAADMLNSLPYTYPEVMTSTTPYQVIVADIGSNKIQITSTGQSQDATSSREISLQVYYSTAFNIPISPLASNGKLNIDDTGTINDGCEGLAKADCRSPGNIADKLVVSQPGSEQEATDLCTGSTLGADSIDDSAIYGSTEDENGDSRFQKIVDNNWAEATSAAGSVFDQVTPITDMSNPESLFESTFGVTLEDGKDELASSGDVARIDMTDSNAVSCSDQLNDIEDDISVIYIKGDCNIDQNDASHSNTSENKRFTVGTPEHPKMVFMEGGTFVTQPNTGASVIGMLYFIPASHDVVNESGEVVYDAEGVKQTIDDQSVDMGGIRVNGALLSEYNCSADGYDKTDNNGTKQHFSTRYDKTVLNNLYGQLGMTPSGSSYQLVAGSWRDF